MRRRLLIAVCLVAVSAPAFAGRGAGDTRLHFKLIEGSEPQIEAILIGAGKIRTDSKGVSVIVDAAGKEMINLDHDRKVFMRVAGAEFDKMFGAIGAAAGELTKILGEYSMDEQPVEGPIAGRHCTRQRLLVQKAVISETCYAKVDQLKLPAGDAAIVKATLALFAEASARAGLVSPPGLGINTTGRPIRQTTVTAGVRHTSELVRVSHDALPAAAFTVPSNYKEEKFGR